MTDETKQTVKHTVNGDEQNGWYCYSCGFHTWAVSLAAEHDGLETEKEL